MRNSLSVLILLLFMSAAAPLQADVATAVRVLAVLAQLQQSADHDFPLTAPDPRLDNEGGYLVPYKADGTLTDWGQRAMTARAGGAAGRAAGRRAGGLLASRVPGGGLFSGRVTEASGAAAAAQALGGWDEIRAQTELSFDDMDDLAVYLHVNYVGTADYDKALGATMELYPELKNGYEAAIRRAIQQQRSLVPAQ